MSLPRSSVNQFQVENLNVPGAQLIKSPVYSDIRGSLYESFHVLKLSSACSVSNLIGIYPPRHAVYGPVSHSGEELVYLIRGKLFVAIIDHNHFEKKNLLTIEPGTVVRIPAFAIHAFLTLDDTTIYDIVRMESHVIEEHYEINDPRLGIEWPSSELPPFSVLTLKKVNPGQDQCLLPKRPMYAIMGANGMIGSSFVREIERRGCSWYQLRSRLHMHGSIRNELISLRPTVGVIIAAGVGTRPNTKWCEDHRLETIDANVTCQLQIAKICEELGLHLTLIGTCGFYHYDESHSLNSDRGFTESDAPNNGCNFYYKMRIYLENLLNETNAISRVLNLRAFFPFDHKVTSSSLIGKLLKFSKINCIKTSMTALDSLVPLALDMINDREVGHVNWVCRGTYTNGDLLNAYKKIVDPSITINQVEVSQEQSRSSGNSAALVIPKRLIDKFGFEKVPTIEAAAEKTMQLIKEEKEKNH